ncbi:putative HERV-K-5q33.3 provirus ancestral Pol protein [Cricetulus griseus]|nr:putative HERV-K-5q33.3 provirus ancestral Pol protein [Cricetulus griseus]
MLTDLRAINKGKLRLRQLTGKDPAQIIVPLTNDEISSLWKDNEYWQVALTDLLGTISNNYPKTDRIKFIKKIVWILPRIVRQTPISGVLTFYTDANKSEASHFQEVPFINYRSQYLSYWCYVYKAVSYTNLFKGATYLLF